MFLWKKYPKTRKLLKLPLRDLIKELIISKK